MNWVAYKEQIFISHTPGGWEVQDQDGNRFGVAIFLLCPHMVEAL